LFILAYIYTNSTNTSGQLQSSIVEQFNISLPYYFKLISLFFCVSWLTGTINK
jgi:hypothetical protein